MVDIKRFKPSLVMAQPAVTQEFFKHFPGNLCITIAPSFRSYINPTQEEWESIVALNKSGSDIYFTVNETNETGRKIRDIVKIRAIFIDDDQPRPYPQEFPLPPSLIIETSRHDSGKKYQYYWLVAITVELAGEWRMVEEGLIFKYGADIAVKDLARLLRVPGFINNKYENKPQCVLAGGNSQVYEWDTIIQVFPPIEEELHNTLEARDEDGEFNIYEYEERFRNPTQPGYISNSLNSIIMHLSQFGYSEGKIEKRINQLFDTVSEETMQLNHKRYYQARVQVMKWIRSAKRKISNERRGKDNIILMPKKCRPLSSQATMGFTPIPRDCIPYPVYTAAQEVGEFLANGIEPSLISAMAITCALLGKNVKINEIGESKTTFCSSGIIVAMESGTRKTEIYKLMNKPFLEYEQLLQKEWETKRHMTQSLEFMWAEQLKGQEAEYKKVIGKGLSENEMLGYANRMSKIREELEKLQIHKPHLHIKDVTEEAVIPKMAENQGMMAVVSDDSRNIIKNVLGRYSKDTTSEGWIIDGIGGTTIKYNRSKDKGTEVIVDEPCLNMYLMVQPDMAIKLKDHEVYRHSGLAARVPIYFYPIDPLDMVQKSNRTRQLDESKMNAYYQILKELCVSRVSEPLIVDIEPAAIERFDIFNKRFLHLLKTEWQGEYSKTNKMITQAVIMSVVMAALDDPAFRTAIQSKPSLNQHYSLTQKHANMGCMYIEALYDGMIKSTENLDNILIAEAALRFAKALLKAYAEKRIYEGFKASSYLTQRFSPLNSENVYAVIDMLVEHGWLIASTTEASGELNNGWPGGQVKPGDVIYHLNVEEVEKMLRIQETLEQAHKDALQ